jgi:biopolymer transport protein ExbD
MRLPQPEMRRGRIEIIPMIDTIFFLLVFFMITWLTMTHMKGMNVSLPRQTKAGGKAPSSVMVSLSPQGGYYLDKRPVAQGVWKERLTKSLIAHPNSVVVLNVASTQKTQTLIELMDEVNGIIAASHTHAEVLIATPRTGKPDTSKNDAEATSGNSGGSHDNR